MIPCFATNLFLGGIELLTLAVQLQRFLFQSLPLFLLEGFKLIQATLQGLPTEDGKNNTKKKRFVVSFSASASTEPNGKLAETSTPTKQRK